MKNTFSTLLFGLLLIANPTAYAADKKDPIDIAMDKGMEKNPSTAGMVEAAQNASNAWEAQLKQSLASLKKEMSPAEWTAMEASQKKWVGFQQAELKAQGEIFSKMEGTMWRPVSVLKALQLTKDRVITLRGYLEVLSEK